MALRVGMAQVDEGDTLGAERRDDHEDDHTTLPSTQDPVAGPPGPAWTRWQEHRAGAVEGCLELGEMEAVLEQVGLPLRFIPDDHRFT